MSAARIAFLMLLEELVRKEIIHQFSKNKDWYRASYVRYENGKYFLELLKRDLRDIYAPEIRHTYQFDFSDPIEADYITRAQISAFFK